MLTFNYYTVKYIMGHIVCTVKINHDSKIVNIQNFEPYKGKFFLLTPYSSTNSWKVTNMKVCFIYIRPKAHIIILWKLKLENLACFVTINFQFSNKVKAILKQIFMF